MHARSAAGQHALLTHTHIHVSLLRCRYEEPNAHRIQSFPRVIADSVRRPDERRKRSREAKAQRQQAEKEAREAEIRHLKNLKKQEIQDM
jgi:protein KRI1